MKKKVVSAAVSVAVLSSTFAGAASASTYAVQKGDTLSVIAKKNHMSVQDLKQLNNLRSDLIRVNQVLKLDATLKPEATAPAAKAASVPTPSTVAANYTVVSGDTLSGIASRYKMTLLDLMKMNNLSSTLIFPGKQLKVSTGTIAQTTVAPSSANKQESVSDYVIKSGDTLGALAKKFGCQVTDLKKLNQLTTDRIYVGQKLKVISLSASSVTDTPAPVSSPAPAPTVPAAPASPASPTAYVVKNGDTLGTIAAQFNTTVSNLQQLNNLSSEVIVVGQTIKVPEPTVTTSGQPQLANLAAAVIREAKALMGIPYVWGGSTVQGFDCSGFIYYVFNKAGFSTSRYTAAGFYSRSYYVNQPQPGDLVFFDNTYKPGISHVGIYLGDNQFIHADENHGIAITSLNIPYFQQHFDGFKRFY